MAITISEVYQFINEVVGAASKRIEGLEAENADLKKKLSSMNETKSNTKSALKPENRD